MQKYLLTTNGLNLFINNVTAKSKFIYGFCFGRYFGNLKNITSMQ